MIRLAVFALVGLGLTSHAAAQQPAQTAAPEEIPMGVWNGSARVTQRAERNPNPAPRPHNLNVRRVPDPHWIWRGGSRELLLATVAGPGAGAGGVNGPGAEIARLVYTGTTLSYTYSRPSTGEEVVCELARQPGERFEGSCQSPGFSAQVTLTPPPPDPHAGASVAGFALGRWTGIRMLPDGDATLPASLVLRTPANESPGLENLRVTGTFGLPAGSFEASNVRIDGDQLSFTYSAQGGCKLVRQGSGRLEGTCTTPLGQPIIVELNPPAGSAAPVPAGQ